MNRSSIRAAIFVASVAFAFVTLNGCGDKEAKFYGTYESTKEQGKLEIKPEHKGTLSMDGVPAEITWEAAGDDKIIVHMGMEITMFLTPDGNLRDQESTVWKKK